MRVDELRRELARAAEDMPAAPPIALAGVERRAARQRRMAMTKAGALALVVLVGLAVVVVRPSGSGGDVGIDVAAGRTSATGTVKFEGEVLFRTSRPDGGFYRGSSSTTSVRGVADQTRRIARMEFDSASSPWYFMPAAYGPTTVIVVEDQVYVRYPPTRRTELGIPTEWVLADLGSPPALASRPVIFPGDALAHVKRIGAALEEANYVAPRFPKGTRKYDGFDGGVKSATEPMVQSDYDLWIDKKGRLLRIESGQQSIMPDDTFFSWASYKFDYSDYGKPIGPLNAPLPESVSSASSLGLKEKFIAESESR